MLKTSLCLAYMFVCLLDFAIGASASDDSGRITQDFNFGWQFHLGDDVKPGEKGDDIVWRSVRLPHDWSIGLGFTRTNTGCSTGFLPGGIGWYRKAFTLPISWRGDRVAIVFEGIYRLSRVWLNRHEIGGWPSGYVSFVLDLKPYARFGDQTNVLLVRVDHSTYLDTRWYTGSGIYRNVCLVKTAPTHIPEWGVWVQTPEITDDRAKVTVTTEIAGASSKPESLRLSVDLRDPAGQVVATASRRARVAGETNVVVPLDIPYPQRWDLTSPRLYQARVQLEMAGRLLDDASVRFGVRTERFDPNRGFFLNGRSMKIKGVCLHQNAGLVGAAVPVEVWRDRLQKLKALGVNAIRTAHNPQSPEFLALCDEMGFLVMEEFFDEWRVPKKKSLVYLGDDKAPVEAARGYSELFSQWAERDLKDTTRRDRNHPCIILWSIGNEIEWTYPYYQKADGYLSGEAAKHDFLSASNYDPGKIRRRLAKFHPGPDELSETARQLARWVRETDSTRLVTAALVDPSVDFVTGYATALDVVGLNYRAREYDAAHATYPKACLLGSENWGTWAEWKAVRDRDFIAGMFIWTGFAYLGEAGPWPRKGLYISLFDFAGFETPRGHFFETLWRPAPTVWLGTTAATNSEYSYTPQTGWKFNSRAYNPPSMKWLRRWEWDRVAPKWNYSRGEPVVVQAYANTPEVQLFLNGKPLGRQEMDKLKDRIAKWLVPFVPGELKLVGYKSGEQVATDVLRTAGPAAKIQLRVNRRTMRANQCDVARAELQLADAKGVPIISDDRKVTFDVSGPARVLGVDNGSEYSVQPYQTNQLTTWQGRALLLLQAEGSRGKVTVEARSGKIISAPISIQVKR